VKTAVLPVLARGGLRASGRPPKTSREAIIAAAVAILERDPGAGVSLNRIAKEIDVTPMSLYNYFASRDELLQALTAHLMRGLELPADSGAPWQYQLMAWGHSVRTHFKRYPYLIRLIIWEGHTSIAWLEHSLYVNDVLEAAGLRGDALTLAVLWVTRNIMGAINMEVLAPAGAELLEDDILALPEPQPLLDKVRLAQEFVARASYFDDDFSYTLERTCEALAVQMNQAALQAWSSAPRPL